MDWINHDKTDVQIAAVAREQAQVRALVGTGSLFLFLALYLWNDGLQAHNTASSLAIAVTYLAYNLVPLWLSRTFRVVRPRTLISLTVALDPLMLSAALAPLQGAGQLIFFFYLFTILGYGFRLGARAMLVCQAFAMLGFAVVAMSIPGWRDPPIVLWSHLILLLVVPAYARLLVHKLHSALALAERESRAKSRLLAHVSHELRTPLTGILSSAQLIKEDTTDFVIAGRCETILGLTGELLVEINDLLDSAKYDAHALVLESAPFDLRAMMDQVQLSLTATAALKGVRLHALVDPLIIGAVLGDRHFLAKVLMNLGANAVRFTEHGMVELRVRLIEEEPGAYHLRFSCRDTGVGIPAEWQSKIFIPFTQAPGGNQRGVGGTGLGMSISKQLVGLMGGDLKVESEVGKGTLFHFDLRMERPVRPRVEQMPAAAGEVVRGRDILLAEDNLTLRRLLTEILERDQHRVGITSSGEQALTMAQQRRYDLLLLDYNLGDMLGTAVLTSLRERGLSVPAYILTADATEATQRSAMAAGALGVLHKPVTRERLRGAIAAALRHAEPALASAVPAGTAREAGDGDIGGMPAMARTASLEPSLSFADGEVMLEPIGTSGSLESNAALPESGQSSKSVKDAAPATSGPEVLSATDAVSARPSSTPSPPTSAPTMAVPSPSRSQPSRPQPSASRPSPSLEDAGKPQEMPDAPAPSLPPTSSTAFPPTGPDAEDLPPTLDPRAMARLRDISDDPAFLLGLIDGTQRSLQENGDRLLQALTAGRFADVRAPAHLLEGMCATMGLSATAQVTGTLSRMDADRLGGEWKMWHDRLARCITAALVALRECSADLRAGNRD